MYFRNPVDKDDIVKQIIFQERLGGLPRRAG